MNINNQVKEAIAGSVHFKYYRLGELWYETENGLLFSVPINDAGTGVFKSVDNGMFFMRWIRKQLEAIAEEKAHMERNI